MAVLIITYCTNAFDGHGLVLALNILWKLDAEADIHKRPHFIDERNAVNPNPNP